MTEAAGQRDPFYYLRNFERALDWLVDRYADLLAPIERECIETFKQLPVPSQALLVRLIMRKGPLFRGSRINYPEIGCIEAAADPLIALHWIDASPLLTIEALFELLTRAELQVIFKTAPKTLTKFALLATLRDQPARAQSFERWRGRDDECAYAVPIAAICTRFRLLFFGNVHQEWSEFVLADLGVFKYESVALSHDARAFQCREDIEAFFTLYECWRQFHEEQPLAQVLEQLPRAPLNNEWLERRRAKLLFQMAHQCERQGEYEVALQLYDQSSYHGARLRSIRVLERTAQFRHAHELASHALAQPESDAEHQKLQRVQHRLHRRLDLPPLPLTHRARPELIELLLPPKTPSLPVERAALEHLSREDAPVYYVENVLINSLFGLLCWEAIFAPLPGAFFHPFHTGPADLFAPDFSRRRRPLFDRFLACLDSDDYHVRIKHTFHAKQGIQSPFVFWGALTEPLLDTALRCIPAVHLRRCFDRLLLDLRENCTGLPDLIQFWPREPRYRMVEVKGPGDRLQDNQRRWIDYCHEHEMPVAVCHVRWRKGAA
jgi:hypothetical protein